ncbi:hypothetical protein [Leptolyngbya sp. KIOST-1]|uniref:hypothetical protein n=1 Tax=Leptolyngbya sp. KIOST-1 TaxID=1229172 RepID=UPI00055F5273|nr:hypothetical protein [Leptolyngbya sp. KIOST-1]
MNTSYWPIHSISSNRSSGIQLKAAWHWLLRRLDATTEPRVWKSTDASGQTLWNAYDPISQVAIDHASADELRTWLEELHYHS